MLKKNCICILLILWVFSFHSFARKKVTFLSSDGVTITADLYLKAKEFPYILLFHQDGCSRGEYNETAERLMSLDYNCLAVDLRCGDKVNYVENETALSAKRKGVEGNYAGSEKDIKAAIEYAFKKSGQPVILFGSSFSASLCIKMAINNARISAVIAFDPGEYLKPGYLIKDHIKDLDKPFFIATNNKNYDSVKEIFKEADPEQITFFTPGKDIGEHGSKALWSISENNQEYWLALLLFFSKLN